MHLIHQNLAPYNFQLFPDVKMNRTGTHCASSQNVEAARTTKGPRKEDSRVASESGRDSGVYLCEAKGRVLRRFMAVCLLL